MMRIYNHKKLGEGSFSDVFLGELDGMPVALKRINTKSQKYNPAATQNEISIHKQLKHNNIVTLFTTKCRNQYLYLALELMKNGSLEDWLYQHDNPLHPLTCELISKDIAAGLKHIHDLGYIHRDIKPQNILLNTRMQAKISDFGLSITKVAAECTPSGTPNYIAPEVATASLMKPARLKYIESSDIYSLGITLLEMVRQKPPFESMKYLPLAELLHYIANGEHDEIPMDLPRKLAIIISGCLTTNPMYRFSMQIIEQIFSTIDVAVETTEGLKRYSGQAHFWSTTHKNKVSRSNTVPYPPACTSSLA